MPNALTYCLLSPPETKKKANALWAIAERVEHMDLAEGYCSNVVMCVMRRVVYKTHTHTHTHTYTHTHACMHTYVCIHTYTITHIHSHTQTHTQAAEPGRTGPEHRMSGE